MDPEGDRQRALAEDYARRLREQKERTPGYVAPMRWGGLAVGITGVLGIVLTGVGSNDYVTRSEYESRRLKNDLSWASAVLGCGAFATSYFFVPKLAPSRLGRSPRWSVAGGPTNLKLNVSFQ